MKTKIKAQYKILILIMSLFMLTACSLNNNITKDNALNYNAYKEFNVINVDNSNLNIVQNLKIENNALKWDKNENVETYYICYFSNTTAPTIIESKSNSLNLESITENNEIYCFRVGSLSDSNEYVLSEEVYLNPNNYGDYTSNIFYFNEKLQDYYIESQEELNNIMHYACVYKIKNFNIKLSNNFYNSINKNLGAYLNFEKALNKSIEEGFLETMSLSFSSNIINSADNTFQIKLNFFGVSEPKLSLNKLLTQDEYAQPFYSTVSLPENNLNNIIFESDNNLKLVSVNSSDELFWAVQDGATPIFNNQNSSAYKIYNNAKEILSNIISDEMSPVEKTLAIFDYITFNTIYDYQLIYSSSSGQNPYTDNEIITNFTSFYLEGVFNEGLAVCDGFSKAFSLLTNMAGIKSYRIAGDAGGGHAWNKVLLNDKWYVVDITWTELELYDYLTGDPKEYLTRKYFLVSDDSVSTHKADITSKNKNYAAYDNYYFYENFNFKYDDLHYNLIIDSKQKAKALLNTLWNKYQNNQNSSIEVVLSPEVINNWVNYVKEIKNELQFNNDVLKVYDGFVDENNNLIFDIIKVADNEYGSISIVQVHNTFINLGQQ